MKKSTLFSILVGGFSVSILEWLGLGVFELTWWVANIVIVFILMYLYSVCKEG